jgi:hypothetical protein
MKGAASIRLKRVVVKRPKRIKVEEDLTQLQPGLVQRALLGRFRVEGLSERRSFIRFGGRWVP